MKKIFLAKQIKVRGLAQKLQNPTMHGVRHTQNSSNFAMPDPVGFCNFGACPLRRAKLALIALVLFILALLPLRAQETKKFEIDEIKLKCESFQVDDKNKELTLKDCIIEGKDIVLTAPFAKYNTKTQTGLFTGGVKAVNKDTVITADRMNLFYLKKEVILEGSVVLVTIKTGVKKNEKAVGAALAKDKYTLKCNQLDYFWEKEEGWAVGNVHIIQSQAEAFCDRVFYAKGANLAHLIGSVRFIKKSGDYIRSEEAWVDLEKETFLAEKDVEGRFYIQKTKEEKTQDAKKLPQLKEIDLKPEPVTVGSD